MAKMEFNGSYISVLLDKPKSVHDVASKTLVSTVGEIIGGEDVLGHTQRRGTVKHVGPLAKDFFEVGDVVRIKAGSGFEAMIGGDTLQILNGLGLDVICKEVQE